MDSFDISASGLTAQRARLDLITNNIANVETTRTSEGRSLPAPAGMLRGPLRRGGWAWR